jgi:hypothetical protein
MRTREPVGSLTGEGTQNQSPSLTEDRQSNQEKEFKMACAEPKKKACGDPAKKKATTGTPPFPPKKPVDPAAPAAPAAPPPFPPKKKACGDKKKPC